MKMRRAVFSIVLFGWIYVFGGTLASGEGIRLIKATDTAITVDLAPSVVGEVKLLEMEPYDVLDPLRGLTSARTDCQQLDVTNDGMLRMTFLDPAPSAFDPQIQFPAYPVQADFVAQFAMRVRVSGTQDEADMPFRIFGLQSGQPFAYQDILVPSDGAWHTVRAAMTGENWNGERILRIDPANGQTYAPNANAVVDIDWFAVTYRPDFDGSRNHTGMDVFVDLGNPVPTWTGPVPEEIVLPRKDGLRDRLYAKYVLTDAHGMQLGHARYVTDLSGLSYRTDSLQGWSALHLDGGVASVAVSNGILSVQYQMPNGNWEPGIQESGARLVDLDVAKEFAMKYRLRGYRGDQPSIPLAIQGIASGETGNARMDGILVADGSWHVYRTRLDQSLGSAWSGQMRIRLDVPGGELGGYLPEDFDGATLDIDWVTVADDPLFTPSRPLCAGGQLWQFSQDRTFALFAGDGFKGIDGTRYPDKVDLGAQQNKMNLLHSQTIDLSLNPSLKWPVDEFTIGLNGNFVHQNVGNNVRYVTTNGMATTIVLLNSIQSYWVNEGTASQRFNPLRNPLTITNPPNSFSVAHNMMDPVGLAYYRGSLEYIGQYFTDPSGANGQLWRFIIGNELDQHWSWYNVGEVDMETIVDIYLVACRMADLALRSQHPDFRMYLSFTHYWDKIGGSGNPLRAANTRQFLERFAERAREEGDFPWAVCIHPYPVDLRKQDFWNDTGPIDSFESEYLTFKNLQMIRRYLQQAHMLYAGQARPITLGEQGFDVAIDGDANKENEQAAALAYSFKIVEQVPGIESYLYHRQVDHPHESNLLFGLWAGDPAEPDVYQPYRKRPSWFVMRDYGTGNESATLDPYLAYLPIADWDAIRLADIVLQYRFDQADADITTVNMPVYAITNGGFHGTVASSDPQIRKGNINTYGDGQETLLLRLKTGQAGNWQFFWNRAGDVGYSTTRCIDIPVVASDEYRFYLADLSTNALWVGQNITGWRLDPPPAAMADYDFVLDYMLFGPAGDFDGDGIPDDVEGVEDLNGNGLPNMADLDSNGNGWSDARLWHLGLNPHALDSDGDGLPDAWEIEHGFDPFDSFDARWDADGNGFDNLSEYIAGTNPNDATDSFGIAGISGAGVLVQAKPGRTYRLLATTNLVEPVWQEVAVQTVLDESLLNLVDPDSRPTVYYRLLVEW